MMVTQFRTFADLYGRTPLMVGCTPPIEWKQIGESNSFISVANTKTGRTVTVNPIQNSTQAIVSAMQGGQTVQKATAVSTANQSLFAQTLQKLLGAGTSIETTPTAPWYSSIMGMLKKYWLWIVLAVVAIIALAVII